MKREEFTTKIKTLYNDFIENEIEKNGFDIKSNHEECFLTFPVRIMQVTDEIIITFGGYGTHIVVFQDNQDGFDFNFLTDEYENYFKDYEQELTFKDLSFNKEVEQM